MIDKIINYENTKYAEDDFSKHLALLNKSFDNDLRFINTLKLVDCSRGFKIIDIGCNIGIWAKKIEDLGEGLVSICAIDILEEYIDIAKKFNSGENIEYRHLDLLNNDFEDNYFDQAIFLETIEHVDNPNLFLKEIYRILKPGGSLIISTPNSQALYRTIKNILFTRVNKRKKFFAEIEIEKRNTGTQNDHIYLWDYECFFRLLNRAGFEYGKHIITRGRFISGESLDRLFGNFATTQIFKVIKPTSDSI